MRVLDPFAGSGTVLVEADEEDVPSIGIESHPFVARVAQAKISSGSNGNEFKTYASDIIGRAYSIKPDIGHYPDLIHRCFPAEVLAELDQLRRSWLDSGGGPFHLLGWLALAAILRQCSPVGTANWQYVLPKKTKARTAPPFWAFKSKTDQMCLDMQNRHQRTRGARLIQADARELPGVPEKWATVVITSPPYPNNFDYADATRLEMTFFGEIAGWGDLQDSVRRHLVRSCTQHVSPIVAETSKILAATELSPIRSGIEAVCEELDKQRTVRAGKKNYHTMTAAYFLDLARTLLRLRSVTSDGAKVCFVVGDSAPYGVHVPVEKWLGELAVASGFNGFSFRKTRDRNTKWKNRKHRVPLHEGHLLIEG